jgi:ankyrin repeat protein
MSVLKKAFKKYEKGIFRDQINANKYVIEYNNECGKYGENILSDLVNRITIEEIKPGSTYGEIIVPVWNENNIKLIKIAIENKIDINIKNDAGNTPLLLAIYNNKKLLVDKLLDMNADPNMKNLDGIAPLHLAIYNIEKINCYAKLIEMKADINTVTDKNNTPLILLTQNMLIIILIG